MFYSDISGDVTDDAVERTIWTHAQISTAVMLACCPLLCPIFEKMVPKQLFRMPRGSNGRSTRAAAIQGTTRIDVHHTSSQPSSHSYCCSHDGTNEVADPAFMVESAYKTEKRAEYV